MKKTKLIHALSAFLIVPFFITGCFDAPKDMVAPSWDVSLNVPITDKSYTLVEIIKPENNPNLVIVDNEVYDSVYFLFSDKIEKIVHIQDTIKMPVRVAPEEMAIAGAGGGSNSMIYNPDPAYQLDSAMFKSGFLKMTLVNKSFTGSVNYDLKAPGFKNKYDGSSLVIKGTLMAGENRTVKVPIQDYVYAQLKRGGMNTETTQRTDGFLILGAASALTDVDFVTQVTNEEITLSKMVGKLKRTELSYATNNFEQAFGDDVKDMRSKIRFKSTKVELRSRTFGAMKNLKIIMDSMSITGYTRQPNGSLINPVKLLFNGKPYFSDTLVAGQEFVKTFDETNSTIPDFLSQMPDVIKMGSKNVIDNLSTTSKGTISNEDYIQFDLTMSAPAHFAVADAGYQDTVEIEFTQEDKDNIARGNSANLHVDITNLIPLGIRAKATFVDENYQPLFTVKNTSSSVSNEIIEVAPCAVDNNGSPKTPSVSNIEVVLEKSDFGKFKNAKYIVFDVYVRSTGSTNVPGDTYVQVRAKDSVRFKVYGGVNYNLDPEDM